METVNGIANGIANGILLLFVILLVLVGSFAAWLNTKSGKKWLAKN